MKSNFDETFAKATVSIGYILITLGILSFLAKILINFI